MGPERARTACDSTNRRAARLACGPQPVAATPPTPTCPDFGSSRKAATAAPSRSAASARSACRGSGPTASTPRPVPPRPGTRRRFGPAKPPRCASDHEPEITCIYPTDADNPDISDCVGHAEVTGSWNIGASDTLGLTVRHALRDSARGSVRLERLHRLGGRPPNGDASGLRFHTQLFSGCGDSLLDFNRRRTALSVGLSLVDF